MIISARRDTAPRASDVEITDRSEHGPRSHLRHRRTAESTARTAEVPHPRLTAHGLYL